MIGLVASACGGGGADGPEPEVRQVAVELAATPIRDLDLLFVIDDSIGMVEAQLNLATGFPGFFDRLQAVPAGRPNLHLGIISTDVGTRASVGGASAPPIGQIGLGGCGGSGKAGVLQTNNTPVTDRFVIDVEGPSGGRMTNYTGSLAQVFRQMVVLGAGGCGFEQPLAALRLALENNPTNAGFLRPDGVLGVIFLTDEDDCSASSTSMFMNNAALGPLESFRCTRFGVTCEVGGRTPDEMNQVGEKGGCGPSASSDLLDDVVRHGDFLHALKSDDRRVVVGAIGGPSTPIAVELRSPPGGGTPMPALEHVCAQEPVGADPAVRLQAFVDSFQERSAVTPICSRDLSGSLTPIANVLRRAMGSPCVDVALADIDPATEGLQVDCLVSDLTPGPSAIAPCEEDPSARPCWELQPDAASCGSSPAPHLKLVVQRAAAPDPRTVTRMDCRLAK